MSGNMERFVIISGCSGGGKSTLLAELAGRGYFVVEEPGRRVVAEEMRLNGSALPWIDLAAFARRALAVALADRTLTPSANEWVFFDRGLIDAAAALQYATGEPATVPLENAHRYHRRVFLTPPWPEIFCADDARKLDFSAAIDEYERLFNIYPRLGYEVIVLPKTSVEERAKFVIDCLLLPA